MDLDQVSFDSDEGKSIFGSLSGSILQITTRFDHKYDYDIKTSQINRSDGVTEYTLTGGYAVDVFFYLQSLLNFSYVIRPEVSATNFREESVKKGSIDLYLASYSLLMDRVKYVEPTFVIGQSRILAFMDHAFEADSANQSIFITPFTNRLWACIITMLIVFIISLLIFNYFEENPQMGMGDMVFHCISTSLQRGSDYTFFRNSTRISTTLLSIAVLIIMASYSGIMTSIFAVNRYSINSIQDLVNSNYKILIEYGYNINDSTIKIMLQSLTHINSVGHLLRKAETSKFVFVSFGDAIKQVNKGPSSYIIDEETGLNSISEELNGFPCTWQKLSVYNLHYPWVMYMRKNSSFQGPFNSGIVRIRERGILNRIRKKWISQPASACFSGSDSIPFKTITYSQVESAFNAFVIIIFVICPVLFIGEKTVSKLMSRQVKKTSNMVSQMTSNNFDMMTYYNWKLQL